VKTESARRRSLLGWAVEAVSPSEAENVAAHNELRLILDAELDRLPEGYRALVVHYYLEGRSNAEVARLMGCPVGTVKGRLWRARGMLRERLLSHGGLNPDQFSRTHG
jgi:RNA polymerase sigma factor (sigma-70 family)